VDGLVPVRSNSLVRNQLDRAHRSHRRGAPDRRANRGTGGAGQPRRRRAVAIGDVLVELEADAERLALEQSRARVAALDP
jgi:hypothetical protein